jgi:hypothetical protein
LRGSVRPKASASLLNSARKFWHRIQTGRPPTIVKPTLPVTCVSPSYSAVPIPPAAVELLTALAPVLSRWGRWYVFGAQAVTAYGVPRLSADVDVTLALKPNDSERFIQDMAAAGFVARFPDQAFVRRTGVMPFVHQATAMPVDVVLAGSGLEDEFLSRARSADIGGTTIPLIEVGDLIIAKVVAGRPKDLTDASALWRLHGSALDADRLRQTLRLLEEALGQSDLVAGFDALQR